MLSVLPTYVSDGPDNMPSTRLYEGDLGVLMSLLWCAELYCHPPRPQAADGGAVSRYRG